MKKRILVCYLFTKFDGLNQLKDFIKHYKKHKSGIKHKLLVCFKLIEKNRVIYLRKYFKNIKYIEFIDNSSANDFDFGSYKRVSESYLSYNILFLNSHSYPICSGWLQKLSIHLKPKTLIGITASYESMITSIKLKKFYKIFSYLLKLKKYKNLYKPFPNPHIRTSNFLINGNDFYSFIKNKKIKNKEDTWQIESGVYGVTNFFKKKKYKIFVINSDGKKFDESKWYLSQTYNFLTQSKTIISDKHSRKYLKLSKKAKIFSQKKVWGNII